MDREMKNFQEKFFRWPEQAEEFFTEVDDLSADFNVYYCPQVFSEPRRLKRTVAFTNCAWADLDACNPEEIEVPPTFSLQTSPGMFQGIWLFERIVEPERAENISRRIANKHKEDGADHCWNLARLLRVPFTLNYKYAPPSQIAFVSTTGAKYRESEFDVFPQVQGSEYMDIPFPEEWPSATAPEILEEYKHRLPKRAFEIFETTPEEGTSWSHPLWSLLMLLFEAGLAREEAYVVADMSACNKYRRDNKGAEPLWADVCRAYIKSEFNLKISQPVVRKEEPLLTDEERASVEGRDTWIERYITWASGLGDAAEQYHQAGAFVALSTMLAGSVRLPTSFGTVIPNLWFMILADTTLTRKTTSMDIAMDMIDEIADDALLATDGSIEGVFTALSTRPGKPSIFLRDEFSGLLEQMNKRDFLAGFPEMLTKLYDGKTQKRLLRRETIEVKNPVLILYTGGIRSKTQEILSLEQIASGFLPRFVFITAESDVTKMQPLGPPTARDWGIRSDIIQELRTIGGNYEGFQEQKVNGKLITTPTKRVWSAELTGAAWTRYNELESAMMTAGIGSKSPEVYTPVYDRLSKSILKSAILIAASRQDNAENVTVGLTDLVHAIKYGEGWRGYAQEIIASVGHSKDEKRLQMIYRAITRSAGTTRSSLMQSYHLSAQDARTIFDTLEQRGMIMRVRTGRTEMYTPTILAKGEKVDEHQ
jgi:hypothetical protein